MALTFALPTKAVRQGTEVHNDLWLTSMPFGYTLRYWCQQTSFRH